MSSARPIAYLVLFTTVLLIVLFAWREISGSDAARVAGPEGPIHVPGENQEPEKIHAIQTQDTEITDRDAPPVVEPEGPILVEGDVQKPEKIYTPQPQYTEIARKARIQGVVRVQAIIDKHGTVTDVEVLEGLPMGLSDEAVKAINAWKFKPATLDGEPVDVFYTLTVNFRLQ